MVSTLSTLLVLNDSVSFRCLVESVELWDTLKLILDLKEQ